MYAGVIHFDTSLPSRSPASYRASIYRCNGDDVEMPLTQQGPAYDGVVTCRGIFPSIAAARKALRRYALPAKRLYIHIEE